MRHSQKNPVSRYLRVAIPVEWQKRGLFAAVLLPFTGLHYLYRLLRAWAWRLGANPPVTLPVPVVVVGNLNVGGSGKTPLVIHLVQALRQHGYQPGVIARGYGGKTGTAVLLNAQSDASEVGDEPLLIHLLTQAPVAVGTDRIAAAQHLLAAHPECNLIVSDDGLQHRRLNRDLEIAVIHDSSLGNCLLLPSGPLRDPLSRLRSVDVVVLNGAVDQIRVYSPFFRMQTQPGSLTQIAPPYGEQFLADLAHQQQTQGIRIRAVCAIGTPQRFFAALRLAGLQIDERALPDHDLIRPQDLGSDSDYDVILMTAKDAVKCQNDPVLSADTRIWVVSLQCQVDPGLLTFILNRLQSASHGSQTA